jgi:demethylmenaquinone methyltransferase/2-methoxy-6-polyprenyl-1,4-benzoquinol methylase
MSEKIDQTAWDATRLAAVHEQEDKARRVRGMFDAIAPTYELVNSLFSAGQDSRWRKAMVKVAKVQPGDILLDVACGTGDVLRAFQRANIPLARTLGVDFSLSMLQEAAGRREGRNELSLGDALHLPLASKSVSIVSCAFGIRNFQDLQQGLGEMWRVLKPGGRVVILEFSLPRRPILKRLYLYYFKHIMPRAARLISRDRTNAYQYLPCSVLSFVDSEEIISSLQQVGFSRVDQRSMTCGIVNIYSAHKT